MGNIQHIKTLVMSKSDPHYGLSYKIARAFFFLQENGVISLWADTYFTACFIMNVPILKPYISAITKPK